MTGEQKFWRQNLFPATKLSSCLWVNHSTNGTLKQKNNAFPRLLRVTRQFLWRHCWKNKPRETANIVEQLWQECGQFKSQRIRSVLHFRAGGQLVVTQSNFIKVGASHQRWNQHSIAKRKRLNNQRTDNSATNISQTRALQTSLM